MRKEEEMTCLSLDWNPSHQSCTLSRELLKDALPTELQRVSPFKKAFIGIRGSSATNTHKTIKTSYNSHSDNLEIPQQDELNKFI